MEGLAPPLRFLFMLERMLSCGHSVRVAISEYLKEENDEFAHHLRALLVQYDAGGDEMPPPPRALSPERAAVFELVWRGLGGEPLLRQIRDLREEVVLAATQELDEFMANLPMRALLPLLFFIFPGFLILLFGPLLKTMLKGFLQ